MERDRLFQEYEETIQKQAALLQRQQVTIDNLQGELLSEQHKLASASKHHKSRIESLVQQTQTAAVQEFSEEVQLLKQELETALKEKELSQAESRRQALEVQRLHQEVAILQTGTDGVHAPPLGKSHEEYLRVVQVLEEETERLRAELGKLDDEKLQILKSNVELKKKVSFLEGNFEQERQKNLIFRSEMDDKDTDLQEVKASFTDLNSKFMEQSEDLQTILAQTEALQKSKDNLTNILMNVKCKLKEAQTRVAESVRIAEDALLEKDAALLREKHAMNEVSRLEKTVSSLTEEAGRKAQAEVSKIKDDYNISIQKMSQEVMDLEMALNEKQLECDRCFRELKKVTKEAEQAQDDLNRRKEQQQQDTLRFQERINSLEVKLVLLSAEKSKISTVGLQNVQENEQQREELLTRIHELEERLTASWEECAALRIEYEEVKRNHNYISTLLDKFKEETQNTEKYLKMQLRVKTEEVEECLSRSEARLEAADAAHREIVAQLYENNSAIQMNFSKLQSHASAQKLEYEERISELTRCIEECREKNRQMVHSLHEANTNLAVVQNVASQYKDRIIEVEDRLRSAEHKFATLGQKNKSNNEVFS
ncbi:sodium channel and clathrin linker 1-like [Procambarus clarkii]|uniref:sodium channel and clathrin linker 1-like n=1 Tax=Procambarus clarkii TaxID=6728 RepID=UPI003742AC16